MNNEHKDHKISLSDFNFERTSYINETDFEEDIDKLDLPPKMMKLLTKEDKQILPHQEVTKLINLGINDEKKRSQNWLILRFIYEEGNNRPPQKICRYLRLVLPRHARVKYSDSRASVANEARIKLVQQKLRRIKP